MIGQPAVVLPRREILTTTDTPVWGEDEKGLVLRFRLPLIFNDATATALQMEALAQHEQQQEQEKQNTSATALHRDREI